MHPKVVSAGLGAAAGISFGDYVSPIIAWVFQLHGVEMPQPVQEGIAGIITVAFTVLVGWAVPDSPAKT